MDKNYVQEALNVLQGETAKSPSFVADLVSDIRSEAEGRRINEAAMAQLCGERAIALQEQVAALDKLIDVIEWQPRQQD